MPFYLFAFFVVPLLTFAALGADGRRGAWMGSVPVVLAGLFRRRALRADAVLQGVLPT